MVHCSMSIIKNSLSAAVNSIVINNMSIVKKTINTAMNNMSTGIAINNMSKEK